MDARHIVAARAHDQFMAIRVAGLVLVAIQALDVWTTHAILSSGGYEANPLAASILAAGGLGGLALAKAAFSAVSIASGTALARRGFVYVAQAAMVAVVLMHLLMVSSNLHQLVRG